MSTFLGELGKGMMQLGTTYGDTRLANLEADAQRMKEERLQMMQMAQFGMQGTKDVYQMEMGEKKFGLLEEEAVRAKEKHQRTMDAPVGKWTLKEIKHREPTTDVLGTTTSVQLQSTYVLVNDATGETKPYDGRFGPLPKDGGDTTVTVLVTGTTADFEKHARAAVRADLDREATDAEVQKIVARGLKTGQYVEAGTERSGSEKAGQEIETADYSGLLPGDPGFSELLAAEEEGAQAYRDAQDWRTATTPLGRIPYDKIAKIIATASEDNPSDNKFIAKTLGFTVDVFAAAINQLLPEGTTIRNPVMGSKWLMENRGWTVADLVKEVQAQVKTGRVGHPGWGVADKYKADEAARLAALSPEARRMIEINETLEPQGSPLLASIARFVGHPVEAVKLAIQSFAEGVQSGEIEAPWPGPQIDRWLKENYPDMHQEFSKSDFVNDPAKFFKSIPKSLIDSIKTQIGSFTAGTTSSGVDTTTAVGTPDFLPGRPPLNADPTTDGLILTGDAGDMARQQTAVTGIATELPPEILPGEMPAGGLTDGPLDEAIVSQMPYDALVEIFGRSQERMITPGITGDELKILEGNMLLIKTELQTRRRNYVGGAGVEHPDEGMSDARLMGLSRYPDGYRMPTTDIESVSGGFQYPTTADDIGRRSYNPPVRIAGVEGNVDAAQLADFPPGGLLQPTDLRLGASYDPNLEQGVKTLQQIAKESGEEMGTSEVVLKKIMPDITKFVDKVKKAVADDASTSEHTKLLRGIEASYYKVADEISKDNYLKVLTAEMEKAGVADRKPGDFLFKYSTAVIGTLVDGVKWIDKNIPTLYKPSGDVLYEEGSLIEGIKKKGDVAKAETDILKMDYDQSIEHIRNFVKGIKGNNFEIIDRLFQLNGILQKQEGFKKTDYSEALDDVMIGLHTTPEKYK